MYFWGLLVCSFDDIYMYIVAIISYGTFFSFNICLITVKQTIEMLTKEINILCICQTGPIYKMYEDIIWMKLKTQKIKYMYHLCFCTTDKIF